MNTFRSFITVRAAAAALALAALSAARPALSMEPASQRVQDRKAGWLESGTKIDHFVVKLADKLHDLLVDRRAPVVAADGNTHGGSLSSLGNSQPQMVQPVGQFALNLLGTLLITLDRTADRIRYARDPYDALRGAQALAVCTEWSAFRRPDLGVVRRLMSQPLVLDGRNLYDPQEMANAGFEYVSIGRPTPASTVEEAVRAA